MVNSFAIVEYRDLYHLYYKRTGYCLSSSTDYSKVISTLKRLVRKYKTPQRLERALSGLLDKGEVSPKQKEWVDSLCDNGGKDYDSYVKKAVEEALEEARSNTPFNRVKKKNKTTMLRRVHKEEEQPKEVTTKLVRSKSFNKKSKKLLRIN